MGGAYKQTYFESSREPPGNPKATPRLERQKEQLTEMCKIIISKTKLSPVRKKFAACKVVQKGDWTGLLLDYEKVPLLPANKKRNTVKVLDVKSVEHKKQKRKLLLAEDGTVYKVKRSKIENNVSGGWTICLKCHCNEKIFDPILSTTELHF